MTNVEFHRPNFVPTGSAPAFVFRLFKYGPGDGEAEHVHTLDHYTVVLAGAVEVISEGRTRVIRAPDSFVFKANIPHAIKATADGPAMWQCLFPLPPGFEADASEQWGNPWDDARAS